MDTDLQKLRGNDWCISHITYFTKMDIMFALYLVDLKLKFLSKTNIIIIIFSKKNKLHQEYNIYTVLVFPPSNVPFALHIAPFWLYTPCIGQSLFFGNLSVLLKLKVMILSMCSKLKFFSKTVKVRDRDMLLVLVKINFLET